MSAHEEKIETTFKAKGNLKSNITFFKVGDKNPKSINILRYIIEKEIKNIVGILKIYQQDKNIYSYVSVFLEKDKIGQFVAFVFEGRSEQREFREFREFNEHVESLSQKHLFANISANVPCDNNYTWEDYAAKLLLNIFRY